jgi:class 3 adenylate cyclase/pimeloyl-ACP methyl ester carboxylesterase
MESQVRFCTSKDGTRIAYHVMNGGPGLPLVFSQTWASSLELDLQSPNRSLMEQLAQDRTLVKYDPRGGGLSQREIDDSGINLDALVGDLAALVDLLGLSKFHLLGHSSATAQCAAYAVRYPERVERIVFWCPFARGTDRASEETMATTIQLVRGNWGMARRAMADLGFPNGPPEMQRYLSRYFRESVTPEVAARFLEFESRLDVTDLLPHVKAPALVLHRRGDQSVPIRAGRAVAALMPDARFVSLEGAVEYLGWEADEYTGIIRSFLAEGESRKGAPAFPSGGTAIILFADIVDSTALTERIGDAAFREKARGLDGALRTVVRERGGAVIDAKTLGDGILATFPAASQAIAAALACAAAGDAQGLRLHLGLHAGDVIREADNIFGGAVNIAARISALAAPGEVLVSDTVRSLARTSAGVLFDDRGERELKGVGEPVRVYALRGTE